jgi:hypothetical protein
MSDFWGRSTGFDAQWKGHKRPLLVWEVSPTKPPIQHTTDLVALHLPSAPTSFKVTQEATANIKGLDNYALAKWESTGVNAAKEKLESYTYAAQEITITFVLDDVEQEWKAGAGNVDSWVAALTTLTQPQASGGFNNDANQKSKEALEKAFNQATSKWAAEYPAPAAALSFGDKAKALGKAVAALPGDVARSFLPPKAVNREDHLDKKDVKPWDYWLSVEKTTEEERLKQRNSDSPIFRSGLVKFYWGETLKVSGVAKSSEIKILVVDKDGHMRRAEVEIVITGAAFVDTMSPPRGEDQIAAAAKPVEMKFVGGLGLLQKELTGYKEGNEFGRKELHKELHKEKQLDAFHTRMRQERLDEAQRIGAQAARKPWPRPK